MKDNIQNEDLIFRQICDVNGLDPEKIREISMTKFRGAGNTPINAEQLIRTAFNYKAQSLVKSLELGSTSENKNISDGKEYTIGADPAAPFFVINEEFINKKYSEDEAHRLIEALGKIMLPIRA
jgi:hypothetical protein